MNKILNWVLSLTKIGQVASKAQTFLSGYKTYLVGLGLAVPALIKIASLFSEQGTGYLMTITSTEEYRLLMEGIGFITGRAAISKLTADK